MSYAHRMGTAERLVRMVIVPPKSLSGLAGVHFVFARAAMLVAIAMFWYMCQFELIGPWLGDAGPAGALFGVLLSAGLIAVPFWEAFGLRLASEHRQWGFRVLWMLCVVLTFGGHLYLVSAKGGQDRARAETAEETAQVILAEGEALVSTDALETRLAGEQEVVDRLAREHERLSAWRTPLATAIASEGSEPALKAVQIEVSGRRVARGEEPIVEDGRARGTADCRGACGETAEAIEREIMLVGGELAAAERARDATSAEIQARINNEADGLRRQRMAEAAEVAGTETTTANMRAFMDTLGRLGTMLGVDNPERSEDIERMRAANASDIAFLLLVAVVNLISWTNNAGHGRDETTGAPIPQGPPQPLPAAPAQHAIPHYPAAGPARAASPPLRPHPDALDVRGAPPPVRARPMLPDGASLQRPEPDRASLSAQGALAALRAKSRAPKGS